MTEVTEGAEALAEDTPVQEQELQDPNLGTDPPAEATDGDPAGDPPAEAKAKKSAQDRIDELTRDKHAERRRAEALERELEQVRKAQPAQDQPKAEVEPDPADFQFGETDAAYVKALARYEARQEFAEQTKQQAVATEAQTIEQKWTDRQAEFAKTKPDYQAVFEGKWVCSPVMADTIKTSDDGPAVAYHLAQNPDEAKRIASLPPLAQARELGKIEARLTPAVAATPAAKTVSDAPEPAPTIRGAGGKFKAAADTNDFASFEAAYVKT